MRPDLLEKVRIHFQDAKVIKGIYGNVEYEVDTEKLGIHFDGYNYRQNEDSEGRQLLLWEETEGYAKILTYKNNDMKLSKEFIKANADKTLKEVFPEIFKADYNEPILSLNDLLSVWGCPNEIELYKTSPMFKNFERLTEEKLKDK